MADELLNVEEVAKLSGLSKDTVRRKLREGEIKGKLSSDRAGYRVSRDDLRDYLQKAKKPIPAELVTGAGLGAVAGGLLVSLLPISPLFALGEAVVGGITSLLNNDKGVFDDKKENSKEVVYLSVGSLNDQIEAIRYGIQALELKGDDLSVEDKQKILASKAQIKLLEMKIKEIKLKYEMDHR